MRKITVTGSGEVTAKANWVIISMTLKDSAMEYTQAMDMALRRIDKLKAALQAVGVEKDAVKTKDFTVQTSYDSLKDENGKEQLTFIGYVVTHDLRLSFDFDSRRLAQVLSAVASCFVEPEMDINFTVRDNSALHEELLRRMAADARHKAVTLCENAGAHLGKLVSIEYHWGRQIFRSPTKLSLGNTSQTFKKSISYLQDHALEIAPEDVRTSDTAVFKWEING